MHLFVCCVVCVRMFSVCFVTLFCIYIVCSVYNCHLLCYVCCLFVVCYNIVCCVVCYNVVCLSLCFCCVVVYIAEGVDTSTATSLRASVPHKMTHTYTCTKVFRTRLYCPE